MDLPIVAAAFVALMLADWQTAPPAPPASAPMPPLTVNLTAAELTSTFVGNTQKGESINGVSAIYMVSDRNAHGKFDLGQDRGKWTITDDGKLCTIWRGMFGHHESCRTIQKKGDHYAFFEPQGEVSSTVTVLPGNPYKL